MESSLNYKPERVGAVTVEDLRKDLFVEFSKIPTTQDSVLLEREHLQVYLRIRPFTSTESDFGESQDCISIESPDTVVLKAPRSSLTARQSEKLGPQIAQRFQFSKVYSPETTQRQIFDGTTKALVKDVLAGQNSLIFTYGVTNAGKTFTFLGPETDVGILPRSLKVIFNSIEGRIYTQNNIKPHRCIDFTRLTKDQQDAEATIKKNLLRRYKENDLQKSSSSMSNSACSTLLEGSSCSDLNEDSLCLEEDSHVKFSVWVSFCEIYNENIHDLLDFASSSSQRRSVLRLCQDVKGNTFVKDLTWIQVNSADEAYRVLKIGRKNQSFSSTKLNSVSSRSHSIFSIRILRIEDMCVPRVQTISELSLCDLAGSERCAKTQNRGERLKEAGNINTSLLTLGKCINALRLNQTQSKFQQHIPFRESKLTHYLQGFFSGRGKACMIVNINQCASMFDETLNVLKFSAVAQKVVVVNPKPVFSAVPRKSARDVSIMINNVDKKEWTRRSTLIGWESSLEDVQEDEDDEDMEEGEEDEEEEEQEASDDESVMENTVLEAEDDQELNELQQKICELKEKLSKVDSEKLVMESRIREEVTAEFMELFSNMEKDYNERLQREKEIAEERAERRLEILKNLVNKNASELADTSMAGDATEETKNEGLDGMIESMQSDLAKIRKDAVAAQTCLEKGAHSPGAVSKLRAQLDQMAEELLKSKQLLEVKTMEIEAVRVQFRNSSDQLLEANKNYESQKTRCAELLTICQEKDDDISKLQTTLDQNIETANEDRAFIETIKEEILHYRNNCKCILSSGNQDVKDQEIQQLEKALQEKDLCLDELKQKQHSLEQNLKDLTDDLAKQTCAHEAAVSLLEAEKAAAVKLANENRDLASKLCVLQQAASDLSSELRAKEAELSSQASVAAKLSEELQTARALIREREEECSNLFDTVESLKLEAENLRQELSDQGRKSGCEFQETIEALRKECELVMSNTQEKSKRIKTLEQELTQTKEEMCHMQNQCTQLKQEQDAQKEENQNILGHYEAEKLAVEQMKIRQSELQAELDDVKQQLVQQEQHEQAYARSSLRVMELETELSEREGHCAALQERLLHTQDELGKAKNVLKKERSRSSSEEQEKTNAESSKARDEAERRRREMEEQLVHKDAELEAKTQELLKSKEQVNDGLDQIKSLTLDLQHKEKHISDLHIQLSEGGAEAERLRNEITSLTEEIRKLQQQLGDLTEERDQALRNLANKKQDIEELKTEQAITASTQENLQQYQETCQALLAKEKLIAEMRLTLSDKERMQTEQEQVLEARLNEIESLSEELMMLKEKCQKGGETDSTSGNQRQEEQKGEGTARRLTTDEEELERGLGGELKPNDAPQRPEEKANHVMDQSQDKITCKGQLEETAAQDSSVLSTDSEREDKRFPKPQLEISFTPLKPDRVNVRRPGAEESVTVKIRRTARKRKSAEMEKSVDSENRKNLRLRGNSRVNIQSVESPTVFSKKANRLKQQDSPASLKGRKDGTLQKIGDFIQSSPTLLGSKAKKIMAMVAVKSPESQIAETNNKPKRSKRKLFKTQISSPFDIPSHPIIGIDQEDKESDHLIIKRKLRTRTAKK
ncbi:kinesin-like protein KIF20B isoform X1 [Astyanax mexicanus]|uniref:kinesin-like protein KIF20B isoform X1 n=1 Tax=Astyanax mexicanus TaxID=7994 RepID=UPI0020CB335C|nr:kinesin-like protein KIF20B isoform X1 [Astyanax mexicanus]